MNTPRVKVRKQSPKRRGTRVHKNKPKEQAKRAARRPLIPSWIGTHQYP